MRSFLLASLIVALGLRCDAAEKLITVTPLSLAGWSVAGTDGNALSSENRLVLPAGSQLSRKFTDPVIVVHVVAQPVFSEQPEDWPILGLGPVAVAFIRQNGQGHLMLVVNDATIIDLPWIVPLDSTGKQGPLDLLLAYDRVSGTGLVSLQDQFRIIDVPPSTGPTELWLSAGLRSDWPVDTLEVLLPDLDADASGDSNLKNQGSSGASDAGQQLGNKLQAALAQLRSGIASPTAGTVTSAGQTKTAGTAPSLEVYTPPSVRRAHIVSALRAAVTRSQPK